MAGEYQKLYDGYLEYIDLCINIINNIPQAVRLLTEVENFVQVKFSLFGQGEGASQVRPRGGMTGLGGVTGLVRGGDRPRGQVRL